MKPLLKREYERSKTLARELEATGDLSSAFIALERAHILGQRYLIPHIHAHLLMLKIGLKQRDVREIFGQLLRIVATIPGYLLGWVPKGNTGGSNVSALKPIPLRADLAPALADYNVWRDVMKRAIVFCVIALCVIASLFIFDARHQSSASALSQYWTSQRFTPISIGESTHSLSVTPVVNFYGEPGFATEAGVSYLVQTDKHTVLFDLGHNRQQAQESPLEQNLQRLDVNTDELDTVFISHFHRDHIGGRTWEEKSSIGFGFNQPALVNTSIFAPIPLSYPGKDVTTIDKPTILMDSLASTGPIPRQLVLGRVDEQALVIHLENKGLVVVVGCGHQTLTALITHIETHFEAPLYALIGDVHFPLETGRLHIAGIDIQRRLASGSGLFSPISKQDVLNDIALMSQKFDIVALGAHDTSDQALVLVEEHFTGEFIPVRAGKPIHFDDFVTRTKEAR